MRLLPFPPVFLRNNKLYFLWFERKHILLKKKKKIKKEREDGHVSHPEGVKQKSKRCIIYITIISVRKKKTLHSVVGLGSTALAVAAAVVSLTRQPEFPEMD